MSDQDAAAVLLGALAGFGAILMVLALVVWVLTIIAHWKMFTRAGVEGWKSIIPIYSDYMLFKIVWNTQNFFIYLGIVIVYAILSGLNNALGPQVTVDAYGNYVTSGSPNIFLSILSFAAAIAMLVWYVRLQLKTAYAYSKSTGFGVGLVLLNTIFILILGFGDCKYVGPQE
ncbi:MAG: hypothetical protein IKG18_05970 [Atopobiaceae bacterium]|nr:hypothetical protein [Atopobiaceae bacterium]